MGVSEGGARGTINMLMVMFKMVTVVLSLEKLLRENIAGLACNCKRAVPIRIEVKILLEHENTLKVGSCPNDDNFVQIIFLVLFV